ncbi:MAG: hypothetical protein WCO12_04055 [bacterium]
MKQQPISEEEAKKRFSELKEGVSNHSISIPPKTIDGINEELQLLNNKFTPIPNDVEKLLHDREEDERVVKEESGKHQVRSGKAPLNELDAMARWQNKQESDTD